MNLFDVIKKSSQKVDAIENSGSQLRRTPLSIMASATSEIGELAEEVQIHSGYSYKKPGKDGIVGEAIDTICCLLDLIHKIDPSITEDDLSHIAFTKCEKWARLVAEHRDDCCNNMKRNMNGGCDNCGDPCL